MQLVLQCPMTCAIVVATPNVSCNWHCNVVRNENEGSFRQTHITNQKLSNKAVLGWVIEESLHKILKKAASSGGVLRLKDEDDGLFHVKQVDLKHWMQVA